MSADHAILTVDERRELELTALSSQPLEEQYANLEQQHATATLGMWVFLASEVLFFGTLFLGLTVYRFQYPEAFEKASIKLNWLIGGINTIVLLVSSLFIVLAVHYAKLGNPRRIAFFSAADEALLGLGFLCLKGLEYYLDYVDKLIPGWSFDDNEWIAKEGLSAEDVPHVKLFSAFLLDHDGPSRPPCNHRHYSRCNGRGFCLEGTIHSCALLDGGRDGAVLALCGSGVDLSAADALPARHALLGMRMP